MQGAVSANAPDAWSAGGKRRKPVFRLCAAAGPGEILVGSRTVELVGVAGTFEPLPPIRLKGKAQPVPLFRVGGPTPANTKAAS